MQFLYALQALVGSVVVVVCYEMHLSLIYVNGVPLDRSSIPYYKKRFLQEKNLRKFRVKRMGKSTERKRERNERRNKQETFLSRDENVVMR